MSERGRVTAEEHCREENGVTNELNSYDHQNEHFWTRLKFRHEDTAAKNADTFHDNAGGTSQERGGGSAHTILRLDITRFVDPVSGETNRTQCAANCVEYENWVSNQAAQDGESI